MAAGATGERGRVSAESGRSPVAAINAAIAKLSGKPKPGVSRATLKIVGE